MVRGNVDDTWLGGRLMDSEAPRLLVVMVTLCRASCFRSQSNLSINPCKRLQLNHKVEGTHTQITC